MDLNANCNTIKFSGKNLQDLKLGKEFLNLTPKAQSIKEKIDKLDFIKIKNFCCVKESVKRIK